MIERVNSDRVFPAYNKSQTNINTRAEVQKKLSKLNTGTQENILFRKFAKDIT